MKPLSTITIRTLKPCCSSKVDTKSKEFMEDQGWYVYKPITLTGAEEQAKFTQDLDCAARFSNDVPDNDSFVALLAKKKQLANISKKFQCDCGAVSPGAHISGGIADDQITVIWMCPECGDFCVKDFNFPDY
jgi:hypothetical protein